MATIPSATLTAVGTCRSPSSDAIIRARRGRTSSRSFIGPSIAVATCRSPDALDQDLGDVSGLDLVADLLGLHPVLEHGETERACRREDVGFHLHRLLDTQLIHTTPFVLLHPDAAAAAAAAESAG